MDIDTSYIPSYASIEEATMYLIEATETDYNQMMASIGVDDLMQIKESGYTVAVNEAGKIKGVIDKIIAWFKAQWEKVKGLFGKALEFFQKQVDKFHDKISEARLKNIENKIANMKADKKFGKTYEYKQYQAEMDGHGTIFSNLISLDSALYRELEKFSDSFKGDDEFDGDSAKATLDAHFERFASVFGGNDKTKESDLKKKMIEYMRGKEIEIDKSYIQAHYKEMVENCRVFGRTRRGLKKKMDGEKKRISNSVKSIKKASGKEDGFAKAFSVFSPYIKKARVYANMCCGVVLSETKHKMMKEMSALNRLFFISGKDKGSESKDDKKDRLY